jgi:hypothetical protein
MHDTPSDRFARISLPEALIDVTFGLVLTAFAAALWLGADYIEGNNRTLMGPAGFPRGVALIFGAASLLMTARGLAASFRSTHRDDVVVFHRPLLVVANIALVVAYPILLTSFGYYATTGPWLIALLFATGNRKILPIIGYSIGFLLFTKLVFQMLIGVPLP